MSFFNMLIERIYTSEFYYRISDTFLIYEIIILFLWIAGPNKFSKIALAILTLFELTLFIKHFLPINNATIFFIALCIRLFILCEYAFFILKRWIEKLKRG